MSNSNGNGNGSVWSILKQILNQHGPWAFMAMIFVGIIIVFQLQPAAADRKQQAEERRMLLDAVTASLETNSSSMNKMAEAVDQLNRTLGALRDLEHDTQEHLMEFTRGVTTTHRNQTEILKSIKECMVDR